MTKPVNTFAIGSFVVGALLIILVIIFYLSGNNFGSDYQKGLVIFDGSIKGLEVGAPVAFKGVKIGEVTKINLIINTDNYRVLTPVEVRIDVSRIEKTGVNKAQNPIDQLIGQGLRAQLQIESLLTGLLYIQLDFHPDSELHHLPDGIDITADVIVVPTIPTDLEQLSRSLDQMNLQALVSDIQMAANGANRLLNDPEIHLLAGNLNQSLAAIQKLSAVLETEIAVLSPELNRLVSNADQAVLTVNSELPALAATARTNLQQLQTAIASFENTMSSIDYTLSDDSALLYDVREAAQDVSAAARALEALAETLETQPESLLKGKSLLEN